MKVMTRAGIAVALSALSLQAFAQEQEMRPYISGGLSYVFEDSDRNTDDGLGAYVGVGKSLNEKWGFEFSGFYDEFDRSFTGGPRSKEYGAKLDGLYFFSRNPKFSPYMGVGVGGARTEVSALGVSRDSVDPFADAGFGFFHYLGGGDIGLRADLRYRYLDASNIPGLNSLTEPVLRIGAVVALGEKPVVAPPPPGDADGDGVPDDADLCPNTPRGTRVDAKGCPVVLDEDGDGVPDNLDRCPGTAKGLAVDKDGCPLTPRSKFQISGQGADLRFEDVHFEFDKSDLSNYGQEMLDDAARIINDLTERYPSLKVDVSGHTDSVGTDGYNQGLSERRSNMVRQYLIRKGVEAGRISTYSYGESKPVATNDTDEGRRQNRRAETRTRGE